MNSIAQTACYQLQKTDIRVNTICPGLIETGMTSAVFDHARSRGNEGKIGQLNPLARYGLPEGEICTASCITRCVAKIPQLLHRDCQRRALPCVERVKLRQRSNLGCRRWTVELSSSCPWKDGVASGLKVWRLRIQCIT